MRTAVLRRRPNAWGRARGAAYRSLQDPRVLRCQLDPHFHQGNAEVHQLGHEHPQDDLGHHARQQEDYAQASTDMVAIKELRGPGKRTAQPPSLAHYLAGSNWGSKHSRGLAGAEEVRHAASMRSQHQRSPRITIGSAQD